MDDRNKTIYITDVLRLTLEAIVRGNGGNIDIPRYTDLITTPRIEDKRTAEEIVDHFKSKLRAIG